MINKEELKEELKKYGFTEEQIKGITSNISVVKIGNLEKICKNLNVLIENNISLDKISKCKMVLIKTHLLK